MASSPHNNQDGASNHQQHQSGGIDSSIPNNNQLPLNPPPPIHNSLGSNSSSGGGMINVENIFASMTSDANNNIANTSSANTSSLLGGGADGNVPSSSSGGGGGANNIFQNFCNTNSSGGAATVIPVRKYSDSTTSYNRGGRIIIPPPPAPPPACSALGTAAGLATFGVEIGAFNHSSSSGAGGLPSIARTGSDGLSKSMGAASFLLKAKGGHKSFSEADPSPTIRYAGYLLKRSNLPFAPAGTSSMPIASITTTSMDNISATAASLGGVVGGIAPLPDLNALDNNNCDNIEGGQQNQDSLFALPFGGFDESMMGVDDMDSHTNNDNIGLSNILSPPRGSDFDTTFQQQSTMVDRAISTTSATTTEEETSDVQPMASSSTLKKEEPCFCSPIVEYFGKLFHNAKTPSRNDALISSDYMGSTTRMSNLSKKKQSPVKKSPSPSKKKPLSPRPTTQPLPITPTQLSPASSSMMASYNMPLKGPAPVPIQRSEPVPISPPINQNRPMARVGSGNGIASRGSGNQLSQSYSNGSSNGRIGKGTLSTAASSTATPAGVPAHPKVYPPPPPSYIDPKDGHIWRSKYCILEHGILYFYRTAAEGESEEARIEREESREYDQVGEEIVLGEEPSNVDSPRTSFASAPSGSGAGSSRLSLSKLRSSDRKNSGDLFDLSKSPMPYKKSDFFPNLRNSPFHRQGSSVITRGSSMSDSQRSSDIVRGGNGGNTDFDERPTPTRSSPLLHHSNSTSTFHHDADILWEKRVALDCVGAVHSSPEYGGHVFELLAYGTDEARNEDESDVSTRASGSRGGRPQHQQQEVIDRLVLRAGSPDEMNAWMFQFHCSLSSFLQQNLQQFVNSVRNGDQAGKAMARGAEMTRVGSPKHASAGIGSIDHHHHRVASLGPFVHKQSFASSPTTAGGGGGSFHESFSPNVVGSLSHGHGRNALYRRQVRDKSASMERTGAISPLPTPIGTPSGGSSPVDASTSDSKKKQPFMIQPDTSKIQDKIDLPSLKDLRGEEAKKPDIESKAAPEPKKVAPKGKYIPPALRRRMEAAAKAAAAESSGPSASDAITIPKKDAVEKEVPLNDESAKEPLSSDFVDQKNGDGRASSLEESLSDSAFSAGSTSSMLSLQLDDDEGFSTTNIRLGGCADPTVIVGSIVDHLYIDRKASVVGNARLEAYGGTGGGHYESFDDSRHGYGDRSSAQEEEDESMMLMHDLLDKERRSVRNSEAANNEQRSVLKWEVGASSECGIRNSNEDAYVVINNFDDFIQTQGLVSFSQQDLGQTKQQGLFAIFDGHVGNQAARYSAEKFPEILMEEESVLASQDSAYISSIEDRADTILRKAFDRLDREFCSLCTKDGRNWDSGSTALVALIVDDVVSLANLGDCRGVVCRSVLDGSFEATSVSDGWEALDSEQQQDEDPVWDRANGGGDTYSIPAGQLFWKEVTEAHSPLLDEERARIEAANGWIIQETDIPIGQLHRMDMFDKDVVEIVRRCFADRMREHRSDPVRQIQIARTCGDLAVSRAIGDRDFKAAYNMPPNRTELARSWEGPPVFLFPEGHSGRFKGDIVSNVPDIKTFKVGQEGVVDEFLLMACDGLWDVMDGDDAVRIAKDLLFDKKLSAKDGAARLAELAQHLGSSDNITVILIRFYWEECND